MINFCEQTTEFSWNPNASTTKPDRPQHVRPSTCVIAQDYSSAKFTSWRFWVGRGKEKFSARFKKVIISKFHFFFLNRVRLKLR
jgi:hypothetical protein